MRATLVTFPPADGDFYQYVVRCYDFTIDTPKQLETAIRRRYPKAVVEPGRRASDGDTRWFVYRDEDAGVFSSPGRR